MALIEIESQIIVANPDPALNEYERSLVSRLGEMLIMAEERFGERDKTYTIIGVEFMENVQRTDYHGADVYKQIIIRLPTCWLQDYLQCLYLLAHEVFHCISPMRGVPASRLEEGLATYFAKIYMDHLGQGNNWTSHGANYNDAMQDAEALLRLDPDVIKKARTIQPVISLITSADLVKALNNNVVDDLLNRLVINFM